MADELSNVFLTPRQIRVLAHPLRARLLSELRLDGAATATRLAQVLGTNTGATSYHLRQLADVGLVLEDQGAGHGRERWWRSAHDMTSWDRGAYTGDPDATAASDWLTANALRNLVNRAEAWHRAAPAEPAAWREAAAFSDYILTLSATQLRELTTELDAVVERHRRAAADAPDPAGRQVLLYLYPLPRLEES
jgi:predicted ArsR family transcriptional regulator